MSEYSKMLPVDLEHTIADYDACHINRKNSDLEAEATPITALAQTNHHGVATPGITAAQRENYYNLPLSGH
jgi:hypothetical protein